jgi:hypothetical protein
MGDYVEVYRAMGEVQAQIIKGLLESFEIPALVKSNAAPSILQFTVDDLGEYRIMVRKQDEEEARRILENKEDV